LAEQAKILLDEAEENNLGDKALNARWKRWHTCSLCEQNYHGVVRCALGWACWKTYVGQPEENQARSLAMTQLGNGLSQAELHDEAASVRETELSMLRRLGASERSMLVVQGNLSNAYGELGRFEEALRLRQDVYSGYVRLCGGEHTSTLQAAENYALTLLRANRFEEAKVLMRKTLPVARRVFGQDHEATLRMRWTYAKALCNASGATLDDLREAVTTLEDAAPIARRVLGGPHPSTVAVETALGQARAALRARESGDVESIRELVAAMAASWDA